MEVHHTRILDAETHYRLGLEMQDMGNHSRKEFIVWRLI
jgi:hypothetical protein